MSEITEAWERRIEQIVGQIDDALRNIPSLSSLCHEIAATKAGIDGWPEDRYVNAEMEGDNLSADAVRVELYHELRIRVCTAILVRVIERTSLDNALLHRPISKASRQQTPQRCTLGVAQSGGAPALEAGGRWFESSHPDHLRRSQSAMTKGRDRGNINGMPESDGEKAVFIKKQLDRINRKRVPRSQAELGREIVAKTKEGDWAMAWALARELEWSLNRT